MSLMLDDAKEKISSRKMTCLETETACVSISNSLYPLYPVGYFKKMHALALGSNLFLPLGDVEQ